MINYSEALGLITEEFKKVKLKSESIPLEDALHRTLAEDVVADINLPLFDNSAVDGYGIIFDENIREWNSIGEISAGNFKDFDLSKNTTIKIMTGAKIPSGVTSVIPIEDVEATDKKIKLRLDAKFHSGMNIRRMGNDIKENEIALEREVFLRPRHLASAASCGKTELKVYQKLKVAILATGDELIPVNEKPVGDKLRVSNTNVLSGEVLELNQIPINYGFVNDDKKKIIEEVERILKSDADIILTTGGVSVGDYDYLKAIFIELGVKKIFWRAYIKPGKPAFFGTFVTDNSIKLIFGLPGNPVSAQVNFKVYIKENIKKLFGMPLTEIIEAELLNDLRKKDRKRHFISGFLEKREGNYFVASKVSQSSGNLVRLGIANCLIVVEEEKLNPLKGGIVKCIPM